MPYPNRTPVLNNITYLTEIRDESQYIICHILLMTIYELCFNFCNGNKIPFALD